MPTLFINAMFCKKSETFKATTHRTVEVSKDKNNLITSNFKPNPDIIDVNVLISILSGLTR